MLFRYIKSDEGTEIIILESNYSIMLSELNFFVCFRINLN